MVCTLSGRCTTHTSHFSRMVYPGPNLHHHCDLGGAKGVSFYRVIDGGKYGDIYKGDILNSRTQPTATTNLYIDCID